MIRTTEDMVDEEPVKCWSCGAPYALPLEWVSKPGIIVGGIVFADGTPPRRLPDDIWAMTQPARDAIILAETEDARNKTKEQTT